LCWLLNRGRGREGGEGRKRGRERGKGRKGNGRTGRGKEEIGDECYFQLFLALSYRSALHRSKQTRSSATA